MRKLRKRGMDDKMMFLIWELIALGMVIIVILVSVRSVVNNSSYWKRYYAIDNAFIADLENTNQGDFLINYEIKDLNKSAAFLTKMYFIQNKMFEVILKPDSIAVYDAPRKENSVPTTFPYARSPSISIDRSTMTSRFFVISKVGDRLMIADNGLSASSSFNSQSAVSGQNPGTSGTCLSLDTKKTLNATTKFYAFPTAGANTNTVQYVNIVTNTFAADPSLSGTDPFARGEIAFIFINGTETVFYFSATDSLEHNSKSEKMACLLANTYKESNPQFTQKYLSYSADPAVFTPMITARNNDPARSDEFYVIVQLNESDFTTANTQYLTKAITKFYG